MIGDQIELVVLDINQTQVRLGIKAPKNINIHRKEIYDAILKASTDSAENCGNAKKFGEKMKDLFND